MLEKWFFFCINFSCLLLLNKLKFGENYEAILSNEYR